MMKNGEGIYKVMINGKFHEYDNWNKLPLVIDNLISFKPDFEIGPHTEEQHKYINTFNDKMKEILNREKK